MVADAKSFDTQHEDMIVYSLAPTSKTSHARLPRSAVAVGFDVGSVVAAA
jgi:hypothetical protein